MTIGGAWGKLLHMDLSDGRQWVEELRDEVSSQQSGGQLRAN